MKKHLIIISAVLLGNFSFSQQQLENPGFETWENVGTPLAEPTNWSSLKTADALTASAPRVVNMIPGRTGDYAIELEVKSVFTISANGIITNGRIHAEFNPDNGYVYTDANNSNWHSTFTDRPDSLVGWYKYAPVAGDSGKIEIILHSGADARLPRNSTTVANEIASVRYNFTTPQSEWTRFSQPFKHLSLNAPQYILTTITAGDSTMSKAGTKLAIDDLELIYNPLGIQDNPTPEIAVNGSKGFLLFDLEVGDDIFYSVADVTGKVVQSGKALAKTPFYHDSGIYFILVQTRSQTFTKKLYIQQ